MWACDHNRVGVLDIIQGSKNRCKPGSADPLRGRMCHGTLTNAVIGLLHWLQLERFGRLALGASLSRISSRSLRLDQGSFLGLKGDEPDMTQGALMDLFREARVADPPISLWVGGSNASAKARGNVESFIRFKESSMVPYSKKLDACDMSRSSEHLFQER